MQQCTFLHDTNNVLENKLTIGHRPLNDLFQERVSKGEGVVDCPTLLHHKLGPQREETLLPGGHGSVEVQAVTHGVCPLDLDRKSVV